MTEVTALLSFFISNFAADLVRGGSIKHVHEAHRLAEKPV